MTRKRDGVIDKKIGAFIRMQRVKLGISQTDLGKALGVTFQQIQKYERGTNSVASSRIPDLQGRAADFSQSRGPFFVHTPWPSISRLMSSSSTTSTRLPEPSLSRYSSRSAA